MGFVNGSISNYLLFCFKFIITIPQTAPKKVIILVDAKTIANIISSFGFHNLRHCKPDLVTL
jgi:hypothetical protein